MSLAFPTSFPATLGISNDLVLTLQRIGDEDHGQYEAFLVADEIPPHVIAGASGPTAASAFLALMADEPCDLGEGNFPAAAVLVLRDLAHQAVDMVCPRFSSEPLDSAVFAEPPACPTGSLVAPTGELPAPSEFASMALEALQESLPEQFDALLCIVATPTSEEGLASVGVAVAEGLDKVFTARMLSKLAVQYVQEAEVEL